MRFPLTTRFGLVTAVLLGLLMASTAAGASAGRQRAAERGRFLTLYDKCLDVRGGGAADLTPLIQYRCKGSANQRFRLVAADNGRYELRTAHDKCLDVDGASSADLTPVIQYRCTGAANQRFWFRSAGSGRYEIRTLHDKCLDVRGDSAADGTPIIQYRCTGAANQRFRYEHA